MLKYLIPQIALADLPPMFGAAFTGAMVAGAYGVAHDQFTFAISPEYFTKLKFTQFRCADFGLGDRVFVSTIGFIAVSAVGFAATWFLARRLIPRQPRAHAYRQIRNGFMIAFAFGFVFGLFGYGYGLWRGPNADYSYWTPAIQVLGIKDDWSFVRVAYIHNGGYLGGLIGLIVALVVIRPNRRGSTAGSEITNADDKEQA